MSYLGAIDQGTTSTRFIIFDGGGQMVASEQKEHRQIYPRPGWVEHDLQEIWANTCLCIRGALAKAGLRGRDLAAVGITNQRETVAAWDRRTGRPWHNAIVWQDLRGSALVDSLKKEGKAPSIQAITGLVPSPYFSASKIAWLKGNVPGLPEALARGEAVFGTMDSYLVHRLTGGRTLATDATNASRYMLMDIGTLRWCPALLELFGLDEANLPAIVPSFGEVVGATAEDGPFEAEIPICGVLGDQQAALFGQGCFGSGQAKCTYGTGCFLLENTGEELCRSSSGLLATVAFQEAGRPPLYALEGSIAVAGSLVQWARDSLRLVATAQELDRLALEVPDCGGVYIVPAFSGLFAPYWRSDARGIVAGLTGYATRGHICRAILEATAFQAYDIFKAMGDDSGIRLSELKVDGGLTNSEPLMAFQANVLGVPVIRPRIVETTALGAAYAAGLGAGVFKDREALGALWQEERRWTPSMGREEAESKVRLWNKAVQRTLGWTD